MSRLIVISMSMALSLGSALPAGTFYDCSRTGRKNQARCCCRAGAPALESCPKCPKASCDRRPAGSPRAGPPAREREPARGGPVLSSLETRCCSVTYQRTSPGRVAPRDVEVLKKSLDQARVFPSPVTLALDIPPCRPMRTASVPRGAAPVSPPLFLLHCSFLC